MEACRAQYLKLVSETFGARNNTEDQKLSDLEGEIADRLKLAEPADEEPKKTHNLEEFKYEYARLWKSDASTETVVDAVKQYLAANSRLSLWLSTYRDTSDIPDHDFLCRNRMRGTFEQMSGKWRKKLFGRATISLDPGAKNYGIIWLMEDITPDDLGSVTPSAEHSAEPKDDAAETDETDSTIYLYNAFTWEILDISVADDLDRWGQYLATSDEDENGDSRSFRCTYK